MSSNYRFSTLPTADLPMSALCGIIKMRCPALIVMPLKVMSQHSLFGADLEREAVISAESSAPTVGTHLRKQVHNPMAHVTAGDASFLTRADYKPPRDSIPLREVHSVNNLSS